MSPVVASESKLMLLVQNLQSIYLLCRNMIHLRSYLKKFIFSLKLFPDYVSIRTKLCLFSLIFPFLMAPIMHATQRNATQRDAIYAPKFLPPFSKVKFFFRVSDFSPFSSKSIPVLFYCSFAVPP